MTSPEVGQTWQTRYFHFFLSFKPNLKPTPFQIEIFKGEENILTMSQTHSKKFHCTYLLHYYPFDTQVCKVDLQVEEFVKSNVELLPDNMELLTDTELTQYYLQAWTLDFNDPGNVKSCYHVTLYLTYCKLLQLSKLSPYTTKHTH